MKSLQESSKTTKRQKPARKIINISVIAVAVLFAITLAIYFVVVLSVASKIHSLDEYEADRRYDCIVVLGCAVYKDGDPSPFLKDRLKTAVCLYNEGVSDKILLSGDRDDAEEYDEVGAMYEYCISNGVDPEDIFVDIYGYSTYETMYRAYYYYGIRSAIVVTQPYHIYRSTYIACGLGIDAVGVEAVNSGYVVAPHNYVREYGALVKDFVQTIFKPVTSPNGNVYDINGNGTDSWSDYYLQ